MKNTWLVTGALGCIGAWAIRLIRDRGDDVVGFDLGEDRRRVADLLGPDELKQVRWVRGDITSPTDLREAVEGAGANRLVHLAGLQVPFCASDPVKGAEVNVVGTLRVFEAVRDIGLYRVAYASSAAVFGPQGDGPPPDEATPCQPATLYGAYKVANESCAAVFAKDHGVSSAGLRPLTVFGVGRDQGLTSGPTRAMKAAVAGREFLVPFQGATDFLLARDCAAAFLAAAEGGPEGARVYNLHGESSGVRKVLDLVEAEVSGAQGTLTCGGDPLPLPEELDGAAFRRDYPEVKFTPLEAGITETVHAFQALRDESRLSLHDLAADG